MTAARQVPGGARHVREARHLPVRGARRVRDRRAAPPPDPGRSALPLEESLGDCRTMATIAAPVLQLDLSDPRVQALLRHRTRQAMHRRVASARAAAAAARAVSAPGPAVR